MENGQFPLQLIFIQFILNQKVYCHRCIFSASLKHKVKQMIAGY